VGPTTDPTAPELAPRPSALADLKRLVRTGGAYLGGSVVQKAASFALLPLYTRYLTRSDFGAAEVLLQSVFGFGFLVRFGIVEAVLRFFHQFDDSERRWMVVRTAFTFLAVTATLGALAVGVAGAPISRFLIGHGDRGLLWICAYGLWTQSLGELALALLRLEERARAFLILSLANLALSVVATVGLVVVLHRGAAGLLLGNFVGTTLVIVVVGVLYARRIGRPLGRRHLGSMLRFGVPTMPAEISVFMLTIIDRVAIVRLVGLAEAGIYAIAIKVSQVVIVLLGAFYQAWPPFAYSIRDDGQAARLYGLVVSYAAFCLAWLTLLVGLWAPWIVALLAPAGYRSAATVVPLVTLGSSLYCLYLIFIVVLGRVSRTGLNFPLTLVGTLTNLALNVLLIPPFGAAGAGAALVGAYLAMLPAIWLAVRRLFPIPLEWSRLARVLVAGAGLFALGSLTPDHGVAPLLARTAIALAFGLVMLALGFFTGAERDAAARALAAVRRGTRRRSASPGEEPAAEGGGAR
jgi:O-antigen/teichoic acid export membrane protein